MSKVKNVKSRMPGGQSKRNVSQIKKIARHHSATTTGDAISFANYHVNHHGWSTSGYHEVILRDGTVQHCYDDNVITNGVGNHNATTYHICLVGSGAFTAAQEKAWQDRAKSAMQRFNLSVKDVLGHNEFSGANTACPGVNMSQVRSRLKGEATQVSKPTSNKPKPVSGQVADIQRTLNSRYNLNITVDNLFGPETQRALVRALQTELNRQTSAKLTVDGIFGARTRNACINVRQGARGNITWILQAILHCKGFALGAIDGIFGARTRDAVRNFQRANNLAVDGIAGARTFQMLFK